MPPGEPQSPHGEPQLAQVLQSIGSVVREIKTPLSLGALAFFAVVAIVFGLVYAMGQQGAIEPEVMAAALAVVALAALGLIGFIINVLARSRSHGPAVAADRDLHSAVASGGSDFDIPSTLVVCTHGAPRPDGKYPFKSLHVSTLRSWVDGDIKYRVLRRSGGVIKSSRSVSHPLTAQGYVNGGSSGMTEIAFHDAKVGEQFLVVEEDHRELGLTNAERKMPSPEDVVLRTLHKECLLSPRHEYVGTLINHPTERVRFLVYFSPGLFPPEALGIAITPDGKILRSNIVMEAVPERDLVVMEADRPPLNSGVFVYWIWPDAVQPKPHVAELLH